LKNVRFRAAVQLSGGGRSNAAAFSAARKQTSSDEPARAAHAAAAIDGTGNGSPTVVRASACNDGSNHVRSRE